MIHKMDKKYRGYTIKLYFVGPACYRGVIDELGVSFERISQSLTILICEAYIDQQYGF